MNKGKTRDGYPQVHFSFDLDYKGKNYHFNVLELWTKYKLTFTVSYDGGWTYFYWNGDSWSHEMKDQELAELVIEMLELGYESKPHVDTQGE